MSAARLPPFEFRRRGDKVVYRFEPEPGRRPPRWKRIDLDIWCELRPGTGWRVVDASGAVTGWPQGLDSDAGHPPAGSWISAKDGKSYMYDLVYLAESR
ncbi:MAG: hypothetical protein AB7J35_17255 [Dehalococcoidia bacterium]